MSERKEIIKKAVKSGKYDEVNKSIKEYLLENRELSKKVSEQRAKDNPQPKSKRGTPTSNQIKNVFSNAAFNKVYEQMKPLIGSIVRRYANRFDKAGTNFDDMMAIGGYGLVDALKNFDPTKGVKFSTFAYPYIIDRIRSFIRDSNLVYIPRNEITSGRAKHPTFGSLDKEINPGDGDKAMTLGASLGKNDDKLRADEGAEAAADQVKEYLSKIEDPFLRKAIKLKLEGYSDKNSMIDKNTWAEGTIRKKIENDPEAMKSPNYKKYLNNIKGAVIEGMEQMRNIARNEGRVVSKEKLNNKDF